MRNITFTKTCVVAMGIASLAQAQSGPTPGCYTREYSAAHLEAHPDQVARALFMLIQDQTYYDNTDRFAYLVVDFADQGHVRRDGHGALRFDQSLICWEDDNGSKGCSVECDGGSFRVTDETDSTLTIATEYLMVGDTEGCGGAIDLAEKPGQKVKYRLNRTDPAECLARVEN